MSTTSPRPLDDLTPEPTTVPKRVRRRAAKMDVAAEPTSVALRPAGIHTDHDARILDDIALGLRAMIECTRSNREPERLSDVSRLAADEIAHQQYLKRLCEPQEGREEQEQPIARDDDEQIRPEPEATEPLAADVTTAAEAIPHPRTPPWLLARSQETEPIEKTADEQWPRPRKHNNSNSIFLRFGLAATGAAVVVAIAVKDIPSMVTDMVRGPLFDLSSNAAAVFNEGKASRLQARMEAAQRQDRLPEQPQAAPMRLALASAEPQPRAVPIRLQDFAHVLETRREAAMTPWPSPEAARRPEPGGWHETPGRVPTPMQYAAPEQSRANALPKRTLSEEQVAMLRKTGDDYISSGDFVGARAVLERAAQAGDPSAAFALASTYDPVVLARFKVRGLEPDIVKAAFWYERARELGSSEAPHRLEAMIASRAN